MENDNKHVIYVTTPGESNQFPYSERGRKMDLQKVEISYIEKLKDDGSIHTEDGEPFRTDNYYIEHPFKKGTFILLDDAEKVERIIQKDRDEQISQVVGMLGATYGRSYLYETEYENRRVKAKIKVGFGLFKGKTSVKAKEEKDKGTKYHLQYSFIEGKKPNVGRAKEYLKENNLENDNELLRMIESRDAKHMGGEGHLRKHKSFEFEYTQKLNESLETVMSLSKAKAFKVDAKFEAQTTIRKRKVVKIELYFDGAEKEAEEKDKEKVENGLMTKEEYSEKWN